jgi:tRNA(fMet)-specific endonuclease VapC
LILDTTFLVDAERSGADLDRVIRDEDDVAIAAVSVAELTVGVELAEGKTRQRRRQFLDGVLEVIPVIDYDLAVASAHAGLLVAVRRQGRPRGAHDLLIAATAVASDRVVVTADVTAFADLPGVSVQHHRK